MKRLPAGTSLPFWTCCLTPLRIFEFDFVFAAQIGSTLAMYSGRVDFRFPFRGRRGGNGCEQRHDQSEDEPRQRRHRR